MKPIKRALVLSRETIRPLGKLELGKVAGGVVATKGDNHPLTCTCPPTGSGDYPPTTQPE